MFAIALYGQRRICNKLDRVHGIFQKNSFPPPSPQTKPKWKDELTTMYTPCRVLMIKYQAKRGASSFKGVHTPLLADQNRVARWVH